MSAISELVFDDKSIVSYVSLAREQRISIFEAEKNLCYFYEENKGKLNKNEIICGIDKINAENFIIDIKRDEREDNDEIEDMRSLLFSIHSAEIGGDCSINGIINNSLTKPDITINTILPLYPIQCKELKYIKPNYKFKSVEIIAGSKANLTAHDASNKAIAAADEEKERKIKDLQPLKSSFTPKSSFIPKPSNNSSKSKQLKNKPSKSSTKMDSFFNKSDKSIEIKPLYYDEEDDIGSDVELPMMKKNNKGNNNSNNNVKNVVDDDDDDENEDEENDIVESDNDEVSDIIDDTKEKEDQRKENDSEKKEEILNDDEFEYNNSVDSEYEEKEENKNPTKGVYKLVSYIDENGFEVTEEKYVEEEVDVTEEEKEKKKKDDLNNYNNNNNHENIKAEKSKEKNSKSKSKRSLKNEENEKDIPPKKKSKKSSNGQITISSFFKPA